MNGKEQKRDKIWSAVLLNSRRISRLYVGYVGLAKRGDYA